MLSPVTGKTAVRKHYSTNQKQPKKNPTVATTGYLGKHKNRTNTDYIPQQVFPQLSNYLSSGIS